MKRIATALGRHNWRNRVFAVFVLCATTVIAVPAQTFTTLHNFDGTDGGYTFGATVQSTNGSLYGTTETGGANGYGTVFKITPGGKLTTLYGFCSREGCVDGGSPYTGLVQAANGSFYGAASYGGVNSQGTVFKITLGGMLTTLHSFCSQSGCADGAMPFGALVQATDGDFYGTTCGSYCGGSGGAGTVFKITPGGTLTTLYSFCLQSGCPDGSSPQNALIQGTDGNLYGTTLLGGANSAGTVFKITLSGTLTTLHSFCAQSSCTDGSEPLAELIQATDGNFCGTTTVGGANGAGTVFKITPGAKLTTLYSFCAQSGCTDGSQPVAALVEGTDGDLYGTTGIGGANGYGTVFKITLGGSLTTLHSFDFTEGQYVFAPLVQDTNGNFYGTTENGGLSAACSRGCGTVFRLSTGMSPFVKVQPASGKVGAVVKILGTDLTDTISVSFNGALAAFTVLSRTLITATVPAGATSGRVQVATPDGTLSSNVPFRVRP